MDTNVLIVGAGAAGLMAARELSKAGKKVLVLEARERIGGRIYPLAEAEFGYEAAGGAEFIHGDAPITKALAHEIGLTLTNPTEWWSVRDGEPSQVVERISPHDSLLEEKLKGLTTDIPVGEFLDSYFPAGKHDALREFVRRWTEGYNAANVERASTFGLRHEMLDQSSWAQMNIKEGYGPIVRFLHNEAAKHGAEFALKKVVTGIDCTGEEVFVTCADASVYRSKTVLVTVPLPLLKEITFTPAIPERLAAAEKIGYGAVIKIILRFKDKWWTGARQAVFEKMFFLLSNEPVPTWWTQYPEPRTTLTGWLPGPRALEMSTKSDEEILELALQSLSNIFKIDMADLKAQLTNYKIANWPQDPYARGVYSYATPETPAAAAILRKPVADKLFFAGEALDDGGASTVESAFATGHEVAKNVLSGMVQG